MKVIPDWLRKLVDNLLAPIASTLVAAGVSPNALTTIGLVTLVGSAASFGAGYVRVGGLLLLLSGVFDMLDGKVARGGARMTRFGAFYDSTLDRVGEAALFVGIVVFFLTGGVAGYLIVWAVATSVVAMAAWLTVSYARARAEGLMLDCKVGVAPRAERILGLGVPSLLFGAGPDGLLLFGMVTLLGLLAAATVVQRIVFVYRVTRGVNPDPRPHEPRIHEPVPALVESLEKGPSGDRA